MGEGVKPSEQGQPVRSTPKRVLIRPPLTPGVSGAVRQDRRTGPRAASASSGAPVIVLIGFLFLAFLGTTVIGGFFWYRSSKENGEKLRQTELALQSASAGRDELLKAFPRFRRIQVSVEAVISAPSDPLPSLYVNPTFFGLDTSRRHIALVAGYGWVNVIFKSDVAKAGWSNDRPVPGGEPVLDFIIVPMKTLAVAMPENPLQYMPVPENQTGVRKEEANP